MRFSPVSFLLGVMAAVAVPLIARTFRPLAVQATETALDVAEQAQRILAEQKEVLEDVLAEAKARREAGRDSDRRAEQPARRRRRPSEASVRKISSVPEAVSEASE